MIPSIIYLFGGMIMNIYFKKSTKVDRKNFGQVCFANQEYHLELKRNFEKNSSVPESTAKQKKLKIKNMELLFRLMFIAVIMVCLTPLA